MIRQARRLLAFAVAAGMSAVAAHAQGPSTGVISGQVTDAQSSQPLVGVQVRVTGTNLGAQTQDDGRYTIRAVAPGTVQVRVTRIGFAEQARTVTVSAGQTATADFALAHVAVQLAEVVTTATGEQRRTDIPNAVTTVDAASVTEQGTISNVAQVLAARAPGVEVQQGGMIGTGARVRIRGLSSLSLSNEPIYIVDGIRIESGTSSLSPNISVGGTTPSRINDLNPEEIETIDVLRGPSAATLYGTDAANGVIIITTKRGRVGAPRWNGYTEQGITRDQNDWPTAYSSYGRRGTPIGSGASGRNRCYTPDQAAGLCVYDSLTSYNLHKDKDVTPFKDGYRRQYGGNVAGGTQAVRYFVSGEYEAQDGVYRIPPFELQRLASEKVTVRDEWKNPNAMLRGSGRVNLDAAINDKLDMTVRAGYVQENLRLPQNDNNITGLFGNSLLGPGRSDLTANGIPLHGYANFVPGQIFEETVQQDINRFTGSVLPQYRPFNWLTFAGEGGVDYTGRTDSDLCRFNECTPFSTTQEGFKENDRTTILNYTTNFRGTANYRALSMFDTRTTAGVQYTGSNFNRNGSGGTILPVGTSTTTAGAIPFADEQTTLSRTLGGFIEEQIGYAERLTLTLGARTDKSSAFGINYGWVVYPKAGLSWVFSDEPFFPKPSWVNQLRYRIATGAAGVRPGTNDATPYYQSTLTTISGEDTPGVAFSALGNLNLRPEKSTELETGFDATLFGSRMNFEITYYNKRSRDALIQRVIAPSLGTGIGNTASQTSRYENLGRIDNTGLEFTIGGRPIDLPNFGWEATLNGSWNRNKVITLGVPPIVGTTVQQREGYPINGYWQRSYTYSDANGDHLIAPSEVTVADSFTYQGYSYPPREFSLVNGIDFLGRQFRLQAVVDHKGGYKVLNGTDRIRCASFNNCRELNDRSASLADQARVVALRFKGVRNTQSGYMEKADFVRLRELSLSWNAPQYWATRLRAQSLSVTVTGQNVHTWTDFTGVDPESNYGQGDVQNDFLTQAPLSVYSVRFNVGF